ncbi:MAG: calcium/proton exchanger [Thermoleophilia bacterium]|nr:calcium/proton exchanger [Thermoleophilia bacterium]
MTATHGSTAPAGVSSLEKSLFGIGAAATVTVVALEFAHASETLIFVAAALTLVMLAWLLGGATEQLGEHVGGRIAGLMNATLGNLPELVVVGLLIHAAKDEPQLIEVAKASLIGSVLGNVLFVLGLAFLLGGLRHGTQTFRRTFSSLNATMLILALAAIAVPDLILIQRDEASEHLAGLSVAIAIVLFVVYIASTFYFLKDSDDAHAPSSAHEARWSKRMAITVLAIAAAGVGIVSEALVGSMEHTIEQIGISPSFMGFILVPVVGNIAEHLVAVQLAWRNQMDFAVTIALGSSVQVALFVVPAALFLSYALGNPIDFTFEGRQLLALGLAAIIVPFVVSDGESTWIEGLQLIALYTLIAIGFWY